jgi:F-box protein 21
MQSRLTNTKSRYWATVILDRIHRAQALNAWDKLYYDDEAVSVGRALSCFDMFVLHEHHGDTDEVCAEILELHLP